MRLKENQTKHDNGVVYWAREVISKGWSVVYSDLPGNIKPPKIGEYIPDVYGKHGVQEIVIEVETQDSIDSVHTKEQCGVFASWAGLSPNRTFLVKIV